MYFPLFLIPILVGLTAQALKPIINQKQYVELTHGGRKFPRYGGMPSAHLAFATSLATVVGVIDGLNSTTFAIAAISFIFIADDALRMRMFLSRYGLALSKLVMKLPVQEQQDFPYLETRLGHKTEEAVAGFLLGLSMSLLLLYITGSF